MKLEHHSDFLVVMEQVAPFVWQHQPAWYGWNEDNVDKLHDYLAWFWNRGTIAIAYDRLGEIDAVCLVKLFRSLEQFLNDGVHDPCGGFCMIELMCADSARGMARIFAMLKHRWGRQTFVLWDRGERTQKGSPRIYDWFNFEKLARRLTGRKELLYGWSA